MSQSTKRKKSGSEFKHAKEQKVMKEAAKSLTKITNFFGKLRSTSNTFDIPQPAGSDDNAAHKYGSNGDTAHQPDINCNVAQQSDINGNEAQKYGNNGDAAQQSDIDDDTGQQSIIDDNVAQQPDIDGIVAQQSDVDDNAAQQGGTCAHLYFDIGMLDLETLPLLPNAEKLNLYDKHHRPVSTPLSLSSDGKKRRFPIKLLDKYPYLRYSKEKNGLYCGACVLFLPAGSKESKGRFVLFPADDWKNLLKHLAKHVSNKYHSYALEFLDDAKRMCNNPNTQVHIQLDTTLQERILFNKHILEDCIIEAVLFLGKQGLAFRGSNEKISNSNTSVNQGNFLALLQLLAKHNSELLQHLSSPRLKNATYLSGTIQNELIDIVGYHMIQADLLLEIKKAKFYTLLIDEVSLHNKEKVVISVRFVDLKNFIREEVLDVIPANRITGRALYHLTKKWLLDHGLELENLRGQGYDGASNMRHGLAKAFLTDNSLAFYGHCQSHIISECHSYFVTRPNT